MTDQRLMRLAAERRAQDRADRERVPCMVYRRAGFPTPSETTWYVRAAYEHAPPHATQEFCASPSLTSAEQRPA